MSESVTLLSFEKVIDTRNECIASIQINRADAANSFSPAVIAGLIQNIEQANANPDCRIILISGKGKHFSAGADLQWMKDSAKLSREENIKDSGKLTQLFETIYNSPKPTIAVIRGAAYGGAVGIAACCDVSIALEGAKFCLSEAKLGLIPAVILPYLARKMLPGQLKRLALSAQVFNENDAVNYGLCQLKTTEQDLQSVLANEINALLSTGAQAQIALKNLFDQVQQNSLKQGLYTAEAIASARTGHEAQLGLSAFFSKQPTPWTLKLKEDWNINV